MKERSTLGTFRLTSAAIAVLEDVCGAPCQGGSCARFKAHRRRHRLVPTRWEQRTRRQAMDILDRCGVPLQEGHKR